MVTPGLGFLYNNFLGFFDPRPGTPRALVPGKRVAGGASCIVFQDDRPVLGLGSPGGSRLVSSVLQCTLNMLEFGLPPQEAVSVPRFHSEEAGLIFSEEAGLIFLEPAFPEETAAALRELGYRVERSSYMARVQAIRIDPAGGRISPGADPRAEGGVAAWPNRA